MKPPHGMAVHLAIVGALIISSSGIIFAAQSQAPTQPAPGMGAAGEPAARTPELRLRIARDVLATAVTDREPAQAPQPVPADVRQLYYFTEVIEAGAPTTITHIWYWQGRQVAAIPLEVRGPRFRTWSSKTILPTWTGEWRVEAHGPDDSVLSSQSFTVETATGSPMGGPEQPR